MFKFKDFQEEISQLFMKTLWSERSYNLGVVDRNTHSTAEGFVIWFWCPLKNQDQICTIFLNYVQTFDPFLSLDPASDDTRVEPSVRKDSEVFMSFCFIWKV